MRTINKVVLAVFAALVMMTTISYAAKPVIMNNDAELIWKDVNNLPAGAKVAILSGNPEKREAFVARIKLPANYEIPAHAHPINEAETVISGNIIFKLNDKNLPAEISLKSGDFIMIPAKMMHASYTKEETIVQITGMGPWGMIKR